ncbi:MAG: HAMP domain-containing histidine kinase, partial [Hyphomicrobiaceae bacterium]|nr:HAMP domain-containing histidine kinase [Hyphomicrobiaceae bacterium]
PKHREDALSDVIQAYAEKSPALLKKRIQHFLKNEKEYRSYTRNMMTYWQEKILYFGILSAVTLLTTLFIAIIYIQNSIFTPLKDLSKKMNDFLHDKYTYQFSVPAPNEVGHLQATFNALAQRVLNNMDELTTLDRAKTEFLSIASHELRTPLTSIKGSLSLLQSGITGELNDASKNLL